MDISQGMIIDFALNLLGYLAAVLLTLVLYTMVNSRKKKEVSENKQVLPNAEGNSIVKNNFSLETSNLGFVQFASGDKIEKTNVNQVKNVVSPVIDDRDAIRARRRDRSETIRVASQMLKAGASQEVIKSMLPVSDEELALLAFARN